MGGTGERRVLLVVAAAYAVGLVVLVAGPWGWALNRLTVALYVRFRYEWPVAPGWARPEDYGVLLNVLLFVPVGYLLVRLAGRGWWWAVLVAAVGSASIEAAQGLLLAREAAWVDVAANTTGAAMGAAVAHGLGRRASRGLRQAPR